MAFGRRGVISSRAGGRVRDAAARRSVVPIDRVAGAIQFKDERIVSPDVCLFQCVLQTLLQNSLVDLILTVHQILLFYRHAIEVGSVMNQLVRTEVLRPRVACHFAGLEGHLTLGFSPLFGLLALHLSHLSLEAILRRLGQRVKFNGRVLRHLKQLALPQAGRAALF